MAHSLHTHSTTQYTRRDTSTLHRADCRAVKTFKEWLFYAHVVCSMLSFVFVVIVIVVGGKRRRQLDFSL